MYHIYDPKTGDLVSSGTVVDFDAVRAKGLQYKEFPDGYAQRKIWNPRTLNFDPKPGRRVLRVRELIARLTEPELQLLLGQQEATADPAIRALSRYIRLSDRIDLDGPILQGALAVMDSQGMFTPERKAELLADG